MSPLDLLARIDEHAQKTGMQIPKASVQEGEWEGLEIRIAATRCIIPRRDLKELIDVPVMTRLPGTRAWARGAIHLRGELITVLDLPVFFGYPPTRNSRDARILVGGERCIGYLVSAVFDMRRYRVDGLTDDVGSLESELQAISTGVYDDGGHLKALLSLNLLSNYVPLVDIAL